MWQPWKSPNNYSFNLEHGGGLTRSSSNREDHARFFLWLQVASRKSSSQTSPSTNDHSSENCLNINKKPLRNVPEHAIGVSSRHVRAADENGTLDQRLLQVGERQHNRLKGADGFKSQEFICAIWHLTKKSRHIGLRRTLSLKKELYNPSKNPEYQKYQEKKQQIFTEMILLNHVPFQ